MHANADNGWDALDATDGGTLNADHVVLTFAGGADALAYDMRSVARVSEWTATVDSVNSGPVSLTWEGVPATYLVTLTDSVTGDTVVMNDADSYVYDPANAEERDFVITAERISALTDPDAHRATSTTDTASASSGGCVTANGDASPLLPALLLLGVFGRRMLQRKRFRQVR